MFRRRPDYVRRRLAGLRACRNLWPMGRYARSRHRFDDPDREAQALPRQRDQGLSAERLKRHAAVFAAARKARRASGILRPRGAKRSRSRKKAVSRNASATSAGAALASSSRRKAGSGKSLSRQGAPDEALTALPDFGET